MTVYASSLQKKMDLTYKMYDFGNKGYITKDEIRLLLSYVPFQTQGSESSSPLLSDGSPSLKTSTSRKEEQVLIHEFLSKIMGSRNSITSEQYADINMNVSSEMFVSIMRVLYDTLPCT